MYRRCLRKLHRRNSRKRPHRTSSTRPKRKSAIRMSPPPISWPSTAHRCRLMPGTAAAMTRAGRSKTHSNQDPGPAPRTGNHRPIQHHRQRPPPASGRPTRHKPASTAKLCNHDRHHATHHRSRPVANPQHHRSRPAPDGRSPKTRPNTGEPETPAETTEPHPEHDASPTSESSNPDNPHNKPDHDQTKTHQPHPRAE